MTTQRIILLDGTPLTDWQKPNDCKRWRKTHWLDLVNKGLKYVFIERPGHHVIKLDLSKYRDKWREDCF